jgi:hypothetical protein
VTPAPLLDRGEGLLLAGGIQGTRKINRTLELAQGGQSYEAVSRVTTFDASGNVVATFTARASAERVQLEPIPDRP